MSKSSSELGAAYYSGTLTEVDKELARLASICGVRLLDPGILDRVLQNDASVCGTENKLAFDKLRNVLMMHYAVRTRAADSIGQTQTALLMNDIVAELRKRFGDRLGGPPEQK